MKMYLEISYAHGVRQSTRRKTISSNKHMVLCNMSSQDNGFMIGNVFLYIRKKVWMRKLE